jgi:DNA-binding NarL/FixJ family response regulator
MEKITIFIADDHRLLRDAWLCFLNRDHRFLVIGDSGDGAEAIEMVRNLRPDIVLLDLNMAPLDGFEVTRQICKGKPHSRVIGLSMYSNIISVKRLLALGAMGYLTKNSSKEEMMSAIIAVKSGSKFICEEIRNIIAQQEFDNGSHVFIVNRLSQREIEVVQYLKRGLTSKEIALALDVSLKTVEVHRYNILKKLGVKNTASIINFFNLNGL